MDWQLLAPFLTATLLLMVTPDTIVAILTHNTLRHGARAGFLTALGVEFGELLVLSAVFSGLALSQEFLPALFRWLSLAGIAYLIWMALRALLRPRTAPPRKVVARSSRPFAEGMTIAFSNPTTLVFHTAFFPQFISPDHPILEQLLILGAIYLTLSLFFDVILIVAAAQLRPFVNRGAAGLARFGEIGSALLYMTIAVLSIFRLASAAI